MTPLWIVIGLILAAISVSTLGAGFSVVGLSALFSGAFVAVAAMAISLEFAKFVLAAYLHQRWQQLHFLFRYYLATAIVVLSVITSMGIFGFLSDAYQSASTVLQAETIKQESLKLQKANAQNEIARLNRSIEEIPANRISKRIAARQEIEPVIAGLIKQTEQIDLQLTAADLQILEVKKKVGPLVYISKMFNLEIDTVVKYLILVFVFVFDPLAICLVIATTEALDQRRRWKENPQAQTVSTLVTPLGPHGNPDLNVNPSSPMSPNAGEEVIQMKFTDDNNRSTG